MDAALNDVERLARKRQYYEVFSALDHDDDSVDDRGLEQSASFFTTRRPTRSAATFASADPLRAKTDVSARRQTDAQIAAETKVLKRPASALPPPTAMPRALGRSKSNLELNLIPADQQLFRGLRFYFLPNNDINAGRRLRIVKAIQYGVSWQRDWSDFVTHIVVDKGIKHAAVLSFLKRSSLEGVIVVNETWPAECIAYRVLADPSHIRFRVPGAPSAIPTDPQAHRQAASVTNTRGDVQSSPPLKPAGKDVQAKPPSTPRSSLQQQLTPSPVLPTRDSSITDTAERSNQQGEANFEAVISQAKQLAHLPLDDDDDEFDGSRPSSSDNTTAAGNAAEVDARRSWQDGFQCMHEHKGKDEHCINAPTISILQQMADHYQQVNDEWRLRAYRMAIATLRKHPTYVATREEALALPKIGGRLAAKIEEIVTTNGLRRLNNARLEPAEQILQTFLKIYGVGYKQAMKWVQQGIHTIDDLLQRAKLSPAQRIGIEHYEDFNVRIPRAEVEKHGKIVRDGLQHIDKAFCVIIGGSYRRGGPDSSDIDCIITHPTFSLSQIRQAVHLLVQTLTKQGFFTAELSGFALEGGSKWLGASCLPKSKVWRRIDLLLVPDNELGAAKIYFTGNDIFNRSIRLLASKKGMRLNQRGLYKDVVRGEKRERVTEGTLLEGKDERRIFQILGVPWREPHERIV